MHYLLFYDVVTDYEVKRVPFRSLHLEHARRAVERGDVVLEWTTVVGKDAESPVPPAAVGPK